MSVSDCDEDALQTNKILQVIQIDTLDFLAEKSIIYNI